MNRENPITSRSELSWRVADDVAPPRPGLVRVWCAVLRCAGDELTSLEKILSAEERERASRFRTGELRHRFIVSRGVLRTILGNCLGQAPEGLQFTSDVQGKPQLASDSPIQFNLSHSGDLMLLAVAHGTPVGVDVERIRPLKDSQAIARRFFTEREARWLQDMNRETLDRAFFSLWTRKEAILKATGEGIASGLDTFELLGADGTFKDTVPRATEATGQTAWAVTHLEPAGGFVGALAIPDGTSTIQLQTFA